MNISSVSTANSNYFKSTSNSEIAKLEKEKANLENEIQQVNQSKDDEKTKQQKIKEIQAQIELINQEIQQKKSEKANSNENLSDCDNTSKILKSVSPESGNVIDVLV